LGFSISANGGYLSKENIGAILEIVSVSQFGISSGCRHGQTIFRHSNFSYSAKEEREKRRSAEKRGIFIPLGSD
jgi:hypothetical protein